VGAVVVFITLAAFVPSCWLIKPVAEFVVFVEGVVASLAATVFVVALVLVVPVVVAIIHQSCAALLPSRQCFSS
jgi:hypothetical protein